MSLHRISFLSDSIFYLIGSIAFYKKWHGERVVRPGYENCSISERTKSLLELLIYENA